MGIFRKKLKAAPRELDLEFEGRVRRIQFNPGGGFKMTVHVDGKDHEWWVPNDMGNRHCQFIREWICGGGFPEDPDPQVVSKVLGLKPGTWQRIGGIIVVIAAVVTALAAAATFLKS